MKTNKLMIALVGAAAVATTACEKTDRSFSLLDSGSSFQQSASYVVKPVDVLWVIDNSGSMASSQENLVNNFQSFIDEFQTKGYDFRMAVTGTDAWRAAFQANTTNGNINRSLLIGARTGALKFYNDQSLGANFNKCEGGTINPLQKLSDSQVTFMDMLTPDLTDVFVTNARQGICGTGDERAFASLKDFLSNPVNAGFRRPEASLAVIIVSDEDDFSANTTSDVAAGYYREANGDPNKDPLVLPPSSDPADLYNLYRDSRLYSVDSYKTFLDGFAGEGNYNVHTISVLDIPCRTQLNTPVYNGIRIGRRYIQLAEMTGGLQKSLCGNFAASMQDIARKAISKSGTFKLTREPVPETIKVIVNDVEIPNSPTDGWTYNAATWEITFVDSVVPNEGDNVQILFTPARASN